MQKHKFKHFIRMLIVFTLFLSTAQNYANCFATDDGNTVIIIREGTAHGFPKTSSIQATIDGHYLTVVFLENLGQVNIVITDAYDNEIRVESTPTPTGVNIYILNTGSYVVTFTLPNGDEYYGEFEVTD